ncbi:MAG: hypothetical protein QM680_05565 [Luteolibacter sp.]
MDPGRLLAGALSRWPWIFVGAALFASFGIIAGIKMTHPTYAISVALIKRRVPQTVQTSEVGQSFRPVDLNDATLQATLQANEPLDMALKRVNNGIDGGRVRSLTEAKQLEGTDIFYITYHSPINANDALLFSAVWAEEIGIYTQRLQQTEARQVRAILQKEVNELQTQIDDLNQELLNFSKRYDYLGGEAQVSAALAKLSQIELEMDGAVTTAAAKEGQLKKLEEQLRRQSPIELQLKTANEELATLRATYTDVNPLVQAKLQSIAYLEAEIAKLGSQKDGDLESYTGTPLGNQLYLSIITLRNDLFEAQSRIGNLKKMREATASRLGEFPAIVSSYDALVKKREPLLQGLALMSNRLKETEIFASGAPGYWQIFQAPDPRSVTRSSLIAKPVILGIAAGGIGAGLALALTLLFTQRTSRRSILECCVATRMPLIAQLPASYDQDARQTVSHLWITRLAPELTKSMCLLFWTSASSPEEERRFWTMLSEAAAADTGKSLVVRDLTPDTLWEGSGIPANLMWSEHHQYLWGYQIFRASSLPSNAARGALAEVDHWYALVSGQKESLAAAVDDRDLTEVYLNACGGTIAWIERPIGPVRQLADLISSFITRKFS